MLSRVLFLGIILLFFVVLLVNGTLELSTDAMIFPWIIGGLGSILVLVEIVREFGKIWRKSSGATEGKTGAARLRNFLTGIAWILAILPMIYLLGLLFTIPLYLLICLKLNGEKWLLSIILTLITGASFYLVFVVFLQVPFNEGLLISYIKG
jgi:hypothetical protein